MGDVKPEILKTIAAGPDIELIVTVLLLVVQLPKKDRLHPSVPTRKVEAKLKVSELIVLDD